MTDKQMEKLYKSIATEVQPVGTRWVIQMPFKSMQKILEEYIANDKYIISLKVKGRDLHIIDKDAPKERRQKILSNITQNVAMELLGGGYDKGSRTEDEEET